jgi:hypothetical protein
MPWHWEVADPLLAVLTVGFFAVKVLFGNADVEKHTPQFPPELQWAQYLQVVHA